MAPLCLDSIFGLLGSNLPRAILVEPKRRSKTPRRNGEAEKRWRNQITKRNAVPALTLCAIIAFMLFGILHDYVMSGQYKQWKAIDKISLGILGYLIALLFFVGWLVIVLRDKEMPTFVTSWYDPGSTRHLAEDEIAALASGKDRQVSPLAREHYSECSDCQGAVTNYEKDHYYPQGGIHPFRNWHELVHEDVSKPELNRHLTEDEIDAIAGTGWDMVSPLAGEHYQQCDECRRAVSRAEKRGM